jgi:hypothetical protein
MDQIVELPRGTAKIPDNLNTQPVADFYVAPM